jgi:hypothetical protein
MVSSASPGELFVLARALESFFQRLVSVSQPFTSNSVCDSAIAHARRYALGVRDLSGLVRLVGERLVAADHPTKTLTKAPTKAPTKALTKTPTSSFGGVPPIALLRTGSYANHMRTGGKPQVIERSAEAFRVSSKSVDRTARKLQQALERYAAAPNEFHRAVVEHSFQVGQAAAQFAQLGASMNNVARRLRAADSGSIRSAKVRPRSLMSNGGFTVDDPVIVETKEGSTPQDGAPGPGVKKTSDAVRKRLATQVKKNGRHKAAVAKLLKDPTRIFLRADTGGDGQVVEVLGDITTAKHVVFVVPGMTNDIDNYEDTLKKGQSLHAEMRKQAGPDVCVVVWLGYDTPDGSPAGLKDAARSDLAKKGATLLLADVATVKKLNPNAHISIAAHSYGSVVTGQAMMNGLDVPDVVVVGSPGMDVNDRKDLGAPNTTVWAAKAPGTKTIAVPGVLPPIIVPADIVPFLPAHGEDPSAKGFGAERFPAEDVESHSDYFNPGTDSLLAIAAIAVDKRDTNQEKKRKERAAREAAAKEKAAKEKAAKEKAAKEKAAKEKAAKDRGGNERAA